MNTSQMIEFLLKNGFTEQAIAYAAAVNQSTISRIFSGKIQDPKYSVVRVIEQLFMSEMKKNQFFDENMQ